MKRDFYIGFGVAAALSLVVLLFHWIDPDPAFTARAAVHVCIGIWSGIFGWLTTLALTRPVQSRWSSRPHQALTNWKRPEK